MAGKRVHEASNMAALFQNQGILAVGIKALIAPGSSPSKIKDPTSIANAEDIHGNMLGKSFYHPLTSKEIGDEDLDERFHRPEKKMRLTADQIQLLEKSFELENRLEPEKKNQLAKDLGVQPRQVGIWFQNRRARCKTKQLEKDYEALKSSYNVLKFEYDNDLIEKEKLKAEVLQLTEKLILKGKDKCSSGEDELRKPSSQLQNPEAKKLDTAVAACNQEELSSVNSPIFDSNRLHCNNGAGLTANAFGPDHSDLTYLEDGEVEGYSYLKLEENSFNCGFPIEDRCFWFWP